MYSNKFALAIISNGLIQTEKNGVCELPFGTEYTLRLINKHNKDCVVKFEIDNVDASGPGYVIRANSKIDIERFNDVAKKFKFVEGNSKEAKKAGKNSNSEYQQGLIVAKFYLKKDDVPLSQPRSWKPPVKIYEWSCKHIPPAYSVNQLSMASAQLPTKEGVTVNGEHSNQQFSWVNIVTENEYTTLTLRLVGYEYKNNDELLEICNQPTHREIVTELESKIEKLKVVKRLKEELKALELEIYH